MKFNCSGGGRCVNKASVTASIGAIWPLANGSSGRCHRGERSTQRSKDAGNGECALGSPLREIRTMGSERGDGYKRLSRPVPTHQADPPFAESDKRRHGYSRDHRPDCVQVVIALVVTREGLPLAYEVLPGNTAGNTADNTTLRDFLARIERQYGKARRIW